MCFSGASQGLKEDNIVVLETPECLRRIVQTRFLDTPRNGEPLTDERDHFRHERKIIEHSFAIQGRKYLCGAAYLDLLASF